MTRRNDGRCTRSSAADTAAAHSVSSRGTLDPARASSIVARTAFTTTDRGACSSNARIASRSSSALTLGNFRRGSVTVSAAGLAGGLVVGPATRWEAPPSSCQCAREEP